MTIYNSDDTYQLTIERLIDFLTKYQDLIMEKSNPVISNIDIKINELEYDVKQDKQDIYHYSYSIDIDQYEQLKEIDPSEHVLINSDKQNEDPYDFSLVKTNMFNIEQQESSWLITKISEEKINNYSKWYLVKLNAYFLLLSIQRIKNKLITPQNFSKIDKYILGIELIKETNRNKIAEKIIDKYTDGFNHSQKKAFISMVESKNISLIKGPPGTGKTTIIERFLEYSLNVDENRRIICATNLHSSMDSIIEKVNHNNFLLTKKILRLTKKPHSRRTAKQKNLMKDKRADVYVTTLASQQINLIIQEHKWWFNDLKPILIIDEASASNILNVLSYTSNIHKIIVIGDDQQLAPIYNNNDYLYFKNNGFEKEFNFFFIKSFFNFVYERNKEESILLNINYRSKKQIVDFINHFYNKELISNDNTEKISCFEIVRANNYDDAKKKMQYTINQNNLTIKNTIFMCEYKKVIKDLNIFLKRKIFQTTTSIQGNESKNICIFLSRNLNSNNFSSQLDYRTINVAISRAKEKVYIFSYDGIIDKLLIDKSKWWRPIRINNEYISISKIIKKIS